MRRQALQQSPLFASWLEIVERRLAAKGDISMDRGPNARYEWGSAGLTLRQRDAAINDLITPGVAKAEVRRGQLWIVRTKQAD
jgi:hypothetical protein